MSSGKGDLSRLFKTTDGCHTWTLVLQNKAPEGFYDAFWLNAIDGEGIVIGDPVKDRFVILETKDGGENWTPDRSRALRLHGLSVAAFAASNGAVGKAVRSEADTRGPGEDYFPGFVTGGRSGAFLFERWEGPSHPKARYGRGLPGWPLPDWNRRSIPLLTGSESAGAFALALRYTGSPCEDCGFGRYWMVVAVGGAITKSQTKPPGQPHIQIPTVDGRGLPPPPRPTASAPPSPMTPTRRPGSPSAPTARTSLPTTARTGARCILILHRTKRPTPTAAGTHCRCRLSSARMAASGS
jgi:hypothetical protein